MAALGAIARDGADNVMVSGAEDTLLVASSERRDLSHLRVNDKVVLNGKPVTVLHVDNEANSNREQLFHPVGSIVGGGIAAVGIAGFIQGLMAGGATFGGLGLLVAGVGVVIGFGINMALTAATFRPVNLAAIKALGTEVKPEKPQLP